VASHFHFPASLWDSLELCFAIQSPVVSLTLWRIKIFTFCRPTAGHSAKPVWQSQQIKSKEIALQTYGHEASKMFATDRTHVDEVPSRRTVHSRWQGEPCQGGEERHNSCANDAKGHECVLCFHTI
jgi:hypothetical protein